MSRRRYRHSHGKLPKGAYPLPTGGYGLDRKVPAGKPDIRIRVVPRREPDTRKLIRALLALAREIEKDRHSDRAA